MAVGRKEYARRGLEQKILPLNGLLGAERRDGRDRRATGSAPQEEQESRGRTESGQGDSTEPIAERKEWKSER